MKELIFACMLVWVSANETQTSQAMEEDFICFQAAPMMKDFLTQKSGWNYILHERGDGAREFFFWFNSVPPTSKIVSDEVIIFGKDGKNFYWVWVLNKGCWLNLFKVSPMMIDVWLMKRAREEAKQVL